jgi:hypothetical protein
MLMVITQLRGGTGIFTEDFLVWMGNQVWIDPLYQLLDNDFKFPQV